MRQLFNQNGFSHVILLIVLAGIIGVSAFGFYIIKDRFSPSASSKPQTHNLVSVDLKDPVVLKPSDTLSGKSIPNSDVEIFISPEGLKSVIKTNTEGAWSYQIPNDLSKGKHRITVSLLDNTGKIGKIESYKIEVKIDPLSSLNLFNLASTTYAQEGSFDITDWKIQMSELGITVIEEDGEYILYDKETYCQDHGGCIDRIKSPSEMIQAVSNNDMFLTQLSLTLLNNGYDPIESLIPYFPDIYDVETLEEYRNNPPNTINQYKTDIDEATLAGFIQQVSNQLGWVRAWEDENFGDPFKTFISVTDPILGTRAVVKYFTTPVHKLTAEDKLNFLLAIAIIGIPEKKLAQAFNLTSKTDFLLPNMIDDITELKRARGGVPYSYMQQRGAQRWVQNSAVNIDHSLLSRILNSANYSVPGFNANSALRQTKGGFLELAGPTLRGYTNVNINSLDRKLYTSNIESPVCVPGYDGRPAMLPVDYIVDATNLSSYFTKGSLGALFVSCLNGDLRAKTIAGAYQVLEDGGYLIWQAGFPEDVGLMLKNGFEILQSKRRIMSGSVQYDLIVRKSTSGSGSQYPVIFRSSSWVDVENILGRTDQGAYNSIQYVPGSIPTPATIETSSKARQYFERSVMSAFKTGRAEVIAKDILTTIANNHIRVMNEFQRLTGRALNVNRDIHEVAQSGAAYVLGDELLKPEWPGQYVPEAKFFVIRNTEYKGPSGILTLSHELFHPATHALNANGFKRGGTSEKDRVFTGMYELATEMWSDLSNNFISFDMVYNRNCNFPRKSQFAYGGYATNPTGGAVNIQKFLTRLCRQNPAYITELLVFGVGLDADQFIINTVGYKESTNFLDRAFGNQKWEPNYDAFMALYKQSLGIDLSRIKYTSAGIAFSTLSDDDPDKETVIGNMTSFEDVMPNDESFDEQYKDLNWGENGKSVTFVGVEGNIAPGENLSISVLASDNGTFLTSEHGKIVISLRKEGDDSFVVNPLGGGDNCWDGCSVTLPSDLRNSYLLVATLISAANKAQASTTYQLSITGGVSDQLSCSEDQMEFAGCDPSACGKEFWRCKGTTETASFPNETGDCALKGGPNPACENEGNEGGKSNTDEAFDSEGNKVPFFGLLLGPDYDGSLQNLQAEAERRIAEMKDYSGSLEYLKTQTSDPEVVRIINQAQGKVNACYQ